MRVMLDEERVSLVLVRCCSVRASVQHPGGVLLLVAQYGGKAIHAISVVSSLRCCSLLLERVGDDPRFLDRTILRNCIYRVPICLFSAVRVLGCGLYAVGSSRCDLPRFGGSRHQPTLVLSSPSPRWFEESSLSWYTWRRQLL